MTFLWQRLTLHGDQVAREPFSAAVLSTLSSAMAGASSVASSIGGALGLGGASTGVVASGAGIVSGTSTAASGAGLFGGFGSTFGSILSGGATIASVLGAQRAGEDKAYALTMAAGDAETEATLESVKAIERRTAIRKQLLASLGEHDVAAAASGVDLSFGTPAIARRQALADADSAIATDDLTTEFRRQRLAERAANYRRAAAEASAGGLGKAAVLALEGGAKLLRRG